MKRDLRRLPWTEQLRAVAKYHHDRARDRNADPYISVADIRRKFRSICPEGLFSAYCADLDAQAAAKVANDRRAALSTVTPEWRPIPNGAIRRAADLLYHEGVFERRNVTGRPKAEREYRAKLGNLAP